MTTLDHQETVGHTNIELNERQLSGQVNASGIEPAGPIHIARPMASIQAEPTH